MTVVSRHMAQHPLRNERNPALAPGVDALLQTLGFLELHQVLDIFLLHLKRRTVRIMSIKALREFLQDSLGHECAGAAGGVVRPVRREEGG